MIINFLDCLGARRAIRIASFLESHFPGFGSYPRFFTCKFRQCHRLVNTSPRPRITATSRFVVLQHPGPPGPKSREAPAWRLKARWYRTGTADTSPPNVDANAECWAPVLSNTIWLVTCKSSVRQAARAYSLIRLSSCPGLASPVFAPRAGHSRRMLNTSQYDRIGLPDNRADVIICANAGDGRACECGKHGRPMLSGSMGGRARRAIVRDDCGTCPFTGSVELGVCGWLSLAGFAAALCMPRISSTALTSRVALLAMLDAGETLGPPLVVPLEAVLRPPDDPREHLDCGYQRPGRE